MSASENFDHKNPDYVAVFQERIDRLQRLRQQPDRVPIMREYYRHHIADFICDWGVTIDPKNVEIDQPSLVPFLLFPKQREWVEWVVGNWRNRQSALTEKTRQMGFSWLAVSTACSLCLLWDGMQIGFGSRKEEYVDRAGDLKSLFEKARQFIIHLPREFRGGWDINKHSTHMRLKFPETGSFIGGEAGDNIGRGNTTSLHFVDEAAFLERPEKIDASLSQTTNCRIDISTPNGLGNPFAEKRFSGRLPVFTFHWRDDPRKDDAWYQKQVATLDAVTVAQEIDINYAASVERVIIPGEWVQSAVDAHFRLGVAPSGARIASLDVADEGVDRNAWLGSHGVLVESIHHWSGRGADLFGTTQKAMELCEAGDFGELRYDADGLGAGVRGDARVINERRRSQGMPEIQVIPFRGSGAVTKPNDVVPGTKRKNVDYFANAKAQGWWALRRRFELTHRWVTLGEECPPDDIIALSSATLGKDLVRLSMELSQPTYQVNSIGKMVVEKAPQGTMSPNLADAVMMRFAPIVPPMRINPVALSGQTAPLTRRPMEPGAGLRINPNALRF